MDKHRCVPISERKISLEIDDLPDLQPYSKVSPKAYGRGPGGDPWDARGRRPGFTKSRAASSEPSWVAMKSSSSSSSALASDPKRLDSILPDDLNISWEYQPVNRDGKGKVTLQVEAQSFHPGPAAPHRASQEQSQQHGLLSATGKRPDGIGTENVKQEIVTAERGEGKVVLRVTLLAAGFFVGPNGASIH